MNINTAIEKIYLDYERGKKIELDVSEFIDEWKQFKLNWKTKEGTSGKSVQWRLFIRKKAIEHFYVDEYNFVCDELRVLYHGEGFGLKLIAKRLNLTYTRIRTLFKLCNIEMRIGRDVCTNKTRSIRSKNAKLAYENKTGCYAVDVVKRTSKTAKGVQGYYFNKSLEKYVWLRSTYEYIYAKWLDRNNIHWDIEVVQYQLKSNQYRPDFFIYENNVLSKIVEIKGYWDYGISKTIELNELLKLDVVIINDIEPYLYNTTYGRELRKWKQTRLSEQELSELQ